MLIGIDYGILRFIEDADGFQAIEAMARRKSGPVYRLGAEELPHPGEVDFHQLRLQPDRLPIKRQGLPYIHLLRQPWQGVEVDGELEPVGISGLLQERLGLGGVVTVQFLEAPIPLRVPDPRPEGSAKLGVVTHDPEWLHPTPQERIGYGVAVDGHAHGLPYLFLHKGHLGVQLVWRGKVESTKEPHVLDGREYATNNLHALGRGILLQGTID